MIQIYKDNVLISIQDSFENAEYFCKKNRIENPQFIKVIE